MNGKHFLVNFYLCRDLDDTELYAFCQKVCIEEGLTVVGSTYHQFEPQGATFALLLAESHLSVHTWPEHNSIAFDLYVCNHSRDNYPVARAVYERIAEYVASEKTDIKIVERADLFQ